MQPFIVNGLLNMLVDTKYLFGVQINKTFVPVLRPWFPRPRLVFYVVYHQERCSLEEQIDAKYSGAIIVQVENFLLTVDSDKTYEY